MIKKILLGLAVIFIILQFFRIDKSVPETDPSKDFLTLHSPPTQVKAVIEDTCYDCHSYKTNYPWYSNIAPVSWWLQDHIDHGREELNFSTWADYSTNRADHKLEEAAEMVLSEEMPLPSYTYSHWDANLTDDQKNELAMWFEKLRTEMKADTLSEAEN
ncbi:MAG: heme-binding domain-containing protein [Balneola sp.]